MLKRNILFFLLLASTLYLSGCWDSDELEEMLYVHSIGLDYKDERYYVYVQLFNFKSVPTGGESGEEGAQTTVGIGKGETVVDAVHDLYSASQRRIFWGHLSSVVFSENVLGNDIEGALDVLSRYFEIRPTSWIYASEEPLSELLNTLPALGVNVIYSFFGEPMESYGQSSIVKPVKYNRFNAERTEPGQTAIIPVLNISKTKWFDEKGDKSNLKIASVALLCNINFYGFLHGEDAKGVRWFQEDTARTPLVIYNDDGEVSGLAVLKVRKSKIEPILSNEPLRFNMEVKVGGSLVEMSQEISEEEIKESIETQIKEELRTTYEKGLELEADVYSFSHELFRADHNKWKNLTDNENLKLNEDSLADINVDVYLRDTGERNLKH